MLREKVYSLLKRSISVLKTGLAKRNMGLFYSNSQNNSPSKVEGQSKEKMDLLMAFLASVVFITAPLLIHIINNLNINA